MSHKKLKIGCLLVVGSSCAAACNPPVYEIGEPAVSSGGDSGAIGDPAGSGGSTNGGSGGTGTIGSVGGGFIGSGGFGAGGTWPIGAPPLGGEGGESPYE